MYKISLFCLPQYLPPTPCLKVRVSFSKMPLSQLKNGQLSKRCVHKRSLILPSPRFQICIQQTDVVSILFYLFYIVFVKNSLGSQHFKCEMLLVHNLDSQVSLTFQIIWYPSLNFNVATVGHALTLCKGCMSHKFSSSLHPPPFHTVSLLFFPSLEVIFLSMFICLFC